jgi:hypothetical protein
MLEYLLEKKTIRTFLTKYSQNKWNYIVPLLVELAILFLKKHFKTQLTSIQLKEIVEELKAQQKKEPTMTINSSANDEENDIEESEASEDKEPPMKELKKEAPKQPQHKVSTRTNHRRAHQKPSMRPTSSNHMFRKPSSEWRNGDNYISDRSISRLRDKSGGPGKSGKLLINC